MEVMQQIMAAAQSASQLDVAELIRDRTADGSLPTAVHTNGSSGPSTAAPAAAPGLSKRKATTGTEPDAVEEAEGSQKRNVKRLRVEGGVGEQPQEVEEGQAGSHAAAYVPGSCAHAGGNGSSAAEPLIAAGMASDARLPNDGIALPDQAASSGPAAGTSNSRTVALVGVDARLRPRSAAACDQLGQSHGRSSESAGSRAALVAGEPQVDEAPQLATASAKEGAAGTASGPGQQEASTADMDQHGMGQPATSIRAMPDETISQSSELGPSSDPGPGTHSQPGPNSSHTQAGPSAHTQAEPSGGMPDQDTEEIQDSEAKEKREQARSRTRAWRKVLLDGLDLQAELTAAAAAAGLPDCDLAEAETKVESFLLVSSCCLIAESAAELSTVAAKVAVSVSAVLTWHGCLAYCFPCQPPSLPPCPPLPFPPRQT